MSRVLSETKEAIPLLTYYDILKRLTFSAVDRVNRPHLRKIIQSNLNPLGPTGGINTMGVTGVKVSPLRGMLGIVPKVSLPPDVGRNLAECLLVEFAEEMERAGQQGRTDQAQCQRCDVIADKLKIAPAEPNCIDEIVIECDLNSTALPKAKAQDLVYFSLNANPAAGRASSTFLFAIVLRTIKARPSSFGEDNNDFGSAYAAAAKILKVTLKPVLHEHCASRFHCARGHQHEADIVIMQDCVWHVVQKQLDGVGELFCGATSGPDFNSSPVLCRAFCSSTQKDTRAEENKSAGAEAALSAPSLDSQQSPVRSQVEQAHSVPPGASRPVDVSEAEKLSAEDRACSDSVSDLQTQQKNLRADADGFAQPQPPAPGQGQSKDERGEHVLLQSNEDAECHLQYEKMLHLLASSKTQAAAFEEVAKKRSAVVAVVGPPGTGKTFWASACIEYLLREAKIKRQPHIIRVVAETNDAVSSFSSALRRREIAHVRFAGYRVGSSEDPLKHVFDQQKLWRNFLTDPNHPLGFVQHQASFQYSPWVNDAVDCLSKIVSKYEAFRAATFQQNENTTKNDGEGSPATAKMGISQLERVEEELRKCLIDFVDAVCKLGAPVLVTAARCYRDEFKVPARDRSAESVLTLIFDEAAKSTELIPAFVLSQYKSADHLIMMGDHKQGRPHVTTDEAKRRGFDVSLFEKLIDRKVVQPIQFEQQHRMHSSLSAWWSSSFYQGQVLNGRSDDCFPVVAGFPWVRYQGCRDDHFRAAFVDLDKLFVSGTSTGETRHQKTSSWKNNTEADWICNSLLVHLAKKHAPCNAAATPSSSSTSSSSTFLPVPPVAGTGKHAKLSVCVLSSYTGQVEHIRRTLANSRDKALLHDSLDLDVRTVDGYQGREADLVIFSFVRTSSQGFQDSRERTNVALTRAKRGLIVVGSGQVLRGKRSGESAKVVGGEEALATWQSWHVWINTNRANFSHSDLLYYFAFAANGDEKQESAKLMTRYTAHPDDAHEIEKDAGATKDPETQALVGSTTLEEAVQKKLDWINKMRQHGSRDQSLRVKILNKPFTLVLPNQKHQTEIRPFSLVLNAKRPDDEEDDAWVGTIDTAPSAGQVRIPEEYLSGGKEVGKIESELLKNPTRDAR
ncbi:unnamed protein product [Amoebophrya sp. A120]|nr:unnamed protein product [Amoebophrya sp. A120]|eukprot:GSA120T00003120001.1